MNNNLLEELLVVNLQAIHPLSLQPHTTNLIQNMPVQNQWISQTLAEISYINSLICALH